MYVWCIYVDMREVRAREDLLGLQLCVRGRTLMHTYSQDEAFTYAHIYTQSRVNLIAYEGDTQSRVNLIAYEGDTQSRVNPHNAQ
jgi:hypothetical protein